MTAADLDIAEKSVHHALLNGKVNDSLFLPVINAGELCLLGFLLHDLHLIDNLGRNVLGCQLRVIQEESLSVNGDFGNSLAIRCDTSIRTDFDAREFLQEILKHIIVSRLERSGRIFDGILLYDNRVSCGSDTCGIKNPSVRLHIHDAQIYGIFHRNFCGIILIAEKFSLDRIASRSHLVKYSLSFIIGQGIFACGIRAGFCQ